MKMSMLVAPVTMLLYNKFGQDLELSHIRLAFVTAICIGAAILYFMKQAIDQSKEQQPIEFEVKATGKPTEKATLPAAQYDAQELAKLVKKIAPGFMQPLVIQCATIPVTLLESPLFQVYVLKKAAAGTLARPWKEESPFAALTGETGGTASAAATADVGTAKRATTATPDMAAAPTVVQNGS